MTFSFHCHPVPIARSNPLYAEPDTQFPYQPKTIPDKYQAVLNHLVEIRASLAKRNAEIKPQPVKKVTKDVSSINRCDSDEVKRYNYLFTEEQRKGLQNIRRKIELYPQRYSDPIYLRQSQMMLLSPGWSSADRYSCCSITSPVNPSGQCRLHRFCPYCSYQFGRDVQLQFISSYHTGNWFFLTGSFVGSLGMTKGADAYNWVRHWDYYRAALNNLFTDKTVKGFYMIEELAVNRIYNVSTLPHIHAIIDADRLEDSTVLEAAQSIKMPATPDSAPMLSPDIDLVQITSQRDLADRIRYLFKPVNLVKAYETDWRTECYADPRKACTLNSHATDLVLGYGLVNRGRKKMCAKGTLNSRAKIHIGAPRSERHQYKSLLRQIQTESRSYIEQPEIEEMDVTLN